MTSNTPTPAQMQKLEDLRCLIGAHEALAVCFSGGVDSTLLLAVAYEQLGNKAFALTEANALYPQRETDEAAAFCEKLGCTQLVVSHEPQSIAGFCENPPERCYICKLHLFRHLQQAANDYAFSQGFIPNGVNVALAEGSNASDLDDFRPGSKAVKELNVESPLLQACLTKDDIRALSRYLDLPTWDKPSFACLATRFETGEPITSELLSRADASEQLLYEAGFKQVRVRLHAKGELARIEVQSGALDDALAYLKAEGASKLHELGFKHVSLDVDGYRTGSMN